MRMPMAMYHWASPAIGIGNVKVDTHVFSDAQPCWFSIVAHCVVLFHQLRSVTFQRHKHQPKRAPKIISRDPWYV